MFLIIISAFKLLSNSFPYFLSVNKYEFILTIYVIRYTLVISSQLHIPKLTHLSYIDMFLVFNSYLYTFTLRLYTNAYRYVCQ
nr:MAG TPA: hypothetical protein [Caudoviricetes sp.]